VLNAIKSRRVRWRACSTHGLDENCIQNFGLKEDLSVIDDIRMTDRETGCEVVEWMHLAQDRDQWQALLNMIINLWVPYRTDNFVTS